MLAQRADRPSPDTFSGWHFVLKEHLTRTDKREYHIKAEHDRGVLRVRGETSSSVTHSLDVSKARLSTARSQVLRLRYKPGLATHHYLR